MYERNVTGAALETVRAVAMSSTHITAAQLAKQMAAFLRLPPTRGKLGQGVVAAVAPRRQRGYTVNKLTARGWDQLIRRLIRDDFLVEKVPAHCTAEYMLSSRTHHDGLLQRSTLKSGYRVTYITVGSHACLLNGTTPLSRLLLYSRQPVRTQRTRARTWQQSSPARPRKQPRATFAGQASASPLTAAASSNSMPPRARARAAVARYMDKFRHHGSREGGAGGSLRTQAAGAPATSTSSATQPHKPASLTMQKAMQQTQQKQRRQRQLALGKNKKQQRGSAKHTAAAASATKPSPDSDDDFEDYRLPSRHAKRVLRKSMVRAAAAEAAYKSTSAGAGATSAGVPSSTCRPALAPLPSSPPNQA